MDSLIASELKELTKDENRYFVWIVKVNNLLPVKLRLSDNELKMFARLLRKKIK